MDEYQVGKNEEGKGYLLPIYIKSKWTNINWGRGEGEVFMWFIFPQ